MKLFGFGLSLFFINNVASAHTGMSASSVEHSLNHIATSVGTTLAIAIAAYFLYTNLPKAKVQRIRIKK